MNKRGRYSVFQAEVIIAPQFGLGYSRVDSLTRSVLKRYRMKGSVLSWTGCWDHGEIDGALLTMDEELRQRINAQPWLEWEAQNVRQHRRLP